MDKYERSKIPLYISAAAVFAGILGHTVGAVTHAFDMREYYQTYSLFYKIENFALDWLGRWVFEGFENFLWYLPTIAVLFQIVWLVNYIVHKKSIKKYEETEKQKESESKVKTVLFILSFLPITLIVLYSLYCMFGGYETGLFNTYTVYGSQAFIEAFLWTCLIFTIIPILPLMLVWQIVYIFRKTGKK